MREEDIMGVIEAPKQATSSTVGERTNASKRSEIPRGARAKMVHGLNILADAVKVTPG